MYAVGILLPFSKCTVMALKWSNRNCRRYSIAWRILINICCLDNKIKHLSFVQNTEIKYLKKKFGSFEICIHILFPVYYLHIVMLTGLKGCYKKLDNSSAIKVYSRGVKRKLFENKYKRHGVPKMITIGNLRWSAHVAWFMVVDKLKVILEDVG